MVQSFLRGLWKENPALVSMLGLCPMLAVTTSLTRGVVMGSLIVLAAAGSALIVSWTRHLVPVAVRTVFDLLVLATVVALLQLGLESRSWTLARDFGIYLPLIAGNCYILDRLETTAARRPPAAALVQVLGGACGIALAAVVLGGLRELLAYGMLGHDYATLWGAAPIDAGQAQDGVKLPFVLLPAGALIGLGLLAALIGKPAVRGASLQPVPQPAPRAEPPR